MSNKNSGGMAFPCVAETGVNYPDPGMTLRDYFAGQALPGVISAIMSNEGHAWQPHDFANEAYALADAMLAERAK